MKLSLINDKHSSSKCTVLSDFVELRERHSALNSAIKECPWINPIAKSKIWNS